MALVESECTTKWRNVEDLCHLRTASIAATSASNAVCRPPKHLLPLAILWPAPVSLYVITYPKPADVLKESSVQACPVFKFARSASAANTSGHWQLHPVGVLRMG